MNKSAAWRRLVQRVERDPYLRDMELLLRAFAMLTYSESYRPSMMRYLNVFSSRAKRFSEDEVAFLCQLFTEFMTDLKDVDAAHFALSGRFSVGVFEAVFHGCCLAAWEARDLSLRRDVDGQTVAQLAGELRARLQEGTSKSENVRERLATARRVIDAGR